MIDLSICGGTVVTESGLQDLDVHVADGRIVALTNHGAPEGLESAETVDARGFHVLPGVVEPHAHIGLGGADDWKTETESAALGGVTTVFNYVMGSDSYFDQIAAEHAAAGPNTHTDYALHIVPCTQEHLDELDRYVSELGVNSFKYFMNFRRDEGAYLGIAGTDDAFMYEYLRKVAAHKGAVANIHAENIEIVWKLRAELQERGEDSLQAWNQSRPGLVEAEALSRAVTFGRDTGTPIYIVHTSAGTTVEEARKARAFKSSQDQELYLETCAHYLTHTEDTDLGVMAKANPPLRASADVERLWEAIISGEIQTVGSDHSPRHRSKKTGTVWESPAGIAGIGLQLTVLLSEGYHKRGVDLETIVSLVATNPAKIFGIYPQKGAIRVGSDADVTIVDLNEVRRVDANTFGGRAGYNLYEEWDMTGWPVSTLLRGKFTVRDRRIVSAPGVGIYLPRNPSLSTRTKGNPQ